MYIVFLKYICQSNLEFNVRMQEFVELVGRSEKMEAIRYEAS